MYSYYLLPSPNIYLNMFFKRQFQPSEINCSPKWVQQAINAAFRSENTKCFSFDYVLQGSCISFEGADSEGPSGFLGWAKPTGNFWEPSVLTLGH